MKNTSNWVRRSEIVVSLNLFITRAFCYGMVVFVLLLLCYEHSSIYKLDKKYRANTAETFDKLIKHI